MNIIQNKGYYTSLFATLFIVLLINISCNDKYDEHYRFDTSERSELNILDYLKSRGDLSKFVRLLELTGYSDTLAMSQTFTVFALTNDLLADLSLDDSNRENLRKLAANHLVSGARTSSGTVKAFNGKYLVLSKSGDTYQYGGVEIADPNLLAKNGIIHIMGRRVPYIDNIWEFIQKNESVDSLRTYINSLTELVFDENNSYDENNVFVDSVFRESNRFIEELGSVNNELFYATAILPTDVAWKEIYAKISPFYKSLDQVKDGVTVKGEELQVERTKWAIVQDCIFYNLISDPATKDSLISTNGNVFRDPGYLFENSVKHSLSNGYVYLTDRMKNKLKDSWLKTIRVEAESNFYNLVTKANCDLANYNTLGTGFVTSDNNYIRFEKLPTNDYSKVSAKFPIPNTMANTKYNIYCVFVPTSAIDSNDERPYNLNFYLSYIDEDKSVKKDIQLPVSNPVTEPGQMTKMLIAENYEFSYCDLITSTDYSSEINVFLKVENAATVREERNGIYSRNIAIDCIILEPVTE